MTAPKAVLRRRRIVPGEDMPDELTAWFSGALHSPPWSALLSPGYELLPERWRAWAAEHPDATPPAGYEWLAEFSTTKGETP